MSARASIGIWQPLDANGLSQRALRSARRVTHALNDNLVVGDTVKNQIGVRADDQAPHAGKVSRLPCV